MSVSFSPPLLLVFNGLYPSIGPPVVLMGAQFLEENNGSSFTSDDPSLPSPLPPCLATAPPLLPPLCLSRMEVSELNSIAFRPIAIAHATPTHTHTYSGTSSLFDGKRQDFSSLFPQQNMRCLLDIFKYFWKKINGRMSIFIKYHFYIEVCLCCSASPIS